jgi:hypothetical protein
MVSSCDIAYDLHVVGLVGEHKTRQRRACQQSMHDFRIRRVAANDAMAPQLKGVSETGDGNFLLLRR